MEVAFAALCLLTTLTVVYWYRVNMLLAAKGGISLSMNSGQLHKRVWLAIICIVIFTCLVLALFLYKALSPHIMSANELRMNGAVVFDKPRIIKEFELVDHKGKPFNLSRIQGHWTLVYFGFSRCPDICPTTLADLNRMLGHLNEEIVEKTEVVMVTVDPARDTVDVLSQYVPFFNKAFIGVTGEFLPIRSLANNVSVVFNKVALNGNDIDTNYTVDHTGNLILINPKGHYHGFFKPPFELAKLKTTYQSIVTMWPGT